MNDILYSDERFEYYKDPDGRVVSRSKDQSLGYRQNEISPAVAAVLDRARQKTIYPKKSTIDTLISMQSESIKKAEMYAGYRLLGTYSYTDVFGQEAQNTYIRHQTDERLDRIQDKIDQMSAQMDDMLRLMLGVAKYVNAEKRSFYKQAK